MTLLELETHLIDLPGYGISIWLWVKASATGNKVCCLLRSANKTPDHCNTFLWLIDFLWKKGDAMPYGKSVMLFTVPLVATLQPLLHLY